MTTRTLQVMPGGLIPIEIGDVYAVELEELLGMGGFGSAWRVRDPASGTRYVLKIIQGIKPDSGMAHRVRLEAGVAIPSRYIVPAYGLCEWDATTYLILFAFVPGRSLDQWLEAGTLTDAQKRRIFLQLLRGVADAHHHNVIHRDLKPANAIIDESSGDVKLIDFGISKFKGSGVTLTGEVIGSPPYMAPEILLKDSRTADARTDIYSLGHILYELATGQHFWRRKGWSEFSDLVGYLIQTPPPTAVIELDDFRCDFLPGAKALIARMVQIDPTQRYNSVEDIFVELGIIPDLPSPPPGLNLSSPLLIVESGTNRQARAVLSLRDGERRVLGRGDIAGDDRSISRQHVEFIREGDRYLVRDFSTNGTWLRGIMLEREGAPVEIRHGDRLKLGDVFLRFAFMRE